MTLQQRYDVELDYTNLLTAWAKMADNLQQTNVFMSEVAYRTLRTQVRYVPGHFKATF